MYIRPSKMYIRPSKMEVVIKSYIIRKNISSFMAYVRLMLTSYITHK